MPTKLNSQFSLDLSKIVKSATDTFVQTRKSVQAKAEADFQNAVASNGMSNADQLAYRKAQLDKAKSDNLPDPDYIATLTSSVSTLTKLVRYDKAQKDYFSAYNDFKGGNDNIDHVISILQSQLAGPLSPEEFNSIQSELNSALDTKAQNTNDILSNRVTLAKNDGTATVLNDAISQVKTRIAQAQAAGNDGDVATWNLQLQSLQTSLNTNTTVMAAHDLDLNIGRSAFTAADKLNALNGQIAKADGTTPITINGVKYNSAQEYWTNQRNDYLAGNGTGNFQDYFGEFQKEIKTRMDSVTAVSKFGTIPNSVIDDVSTQYKNLLSKDEFKPFTEEINQQRDLAVGTLANKTAQAVLNEAEAFGNFDQAETALTALQTKYGVDMSSELIDLSKRKITNAANIKSIETAATTLAEQNNTSPSAEASKIAETPATPGAAAGVLGQPEGTTTPPAPGATPTLTPQQEAQSAKPADQISPEAQKIRSGQSPTVVTTQPPVPKPTPSPTSSQPSESAVPGTSYTVAKGDTLSSISQKFLGDANRFKEIASLNNITDPNKISVGQQFKIPTK